MEVSWLNIKNPDEEFRKEVLKKLKANNGYCISKKERSADTRCHCKQYELYGECECGLFLKIPCMEITGDG